MTASGRGRPRFVFDEDELRRLYVDERRTLGELARRFECSERTVAAALARLDPPVTRRRRGPRGPRNHRTPAVDAELYRLYVDAALPEREVAHVLGWRPSTVHQALVDLGVPRRDRTRRDRTARHLAAVRADLRRYPVGPADGVETDRDRARRLAPLLAVGHERVRALVAVARRQLAAERDDAAPPRGSVGDVDRDQLALF